MGFEDAIKNPLSWMRREPAVFLLAVINWLPGLLMLPLAFALLPTVQRLLAQSNGDFLTLLTQHGGELLQAALPFFLVGLVVLILSMLVRALVSLALAHAAAQLRDNQPLRLSDALQAAKSRWGTLIASAFFATLLFLAAFLACVLLLVLAVASVAIPVLGILLALVLGLAFLAALIAAAFGFSAAYFLLPAVVAENKGGAWDAVKSALQFVWTFKLQSIGFVIIIMLAQYALGQLGMAAFPLLALVIVLGMVSELLLQTWTGLYAAEFFFQYGGKERAITGDVLATPTTKADEDKELTAPRTPKPKPKTPVKKPAAKK